jgi:hypothetical protein
VIGRGLASNFLLTESTHGRFGDGKAIGPAIANQRRGFDSGEAWQFLERERRKTAAHFATDVKIQGTRVKYIQDATSIVVAPCEVGGDLALLLPDNLSR